MAFLIPEYLNIDFNTLKDNFITQLQNSDTFKDYNFEGANITILIELMAYIAELNTYYLNKVAKNNYIDTADIYENIHRLSTLLGYNPKGYVAPTVDLTVTLSQEVTGQYFRNTDQLYVPAWSIFSTEEGIEYINTASYSGTVSTSGLSAERLTYSFDLPLKQGSLESLTYNGNDLVDNKIILPFYTFDYDDNTNDENVSIYVSVNNEPWTRLNDFVEDISGLQYPSLTDNVFRFIYDKYGRYIIEFSSIRNVPSETDEIEIKLIKTDHVDGAVGANTIISFDSGFLTNTTRSIIIPDDNISITNLLASSSGAEPEDIEEVRQAAKGEIHSQKRNVTKLDYTTFLESRNDIVQANVWGEREINRLGDIEQYNRIHISLIPNVWNTSTILTSASTWEPFTGRINSIDIPYRYSSTWETTLKTYLEPRKILTTYEEFDLPELIYFAFRIGIKTKRLYNFNDVANDIKNKLAYYFSAELRDFGEIISFMDIHNYILDPSNVSSTDSFQYIKGIDNLVFRDIVLSTSIYNYNTSYNYPMYTREEFDSTYDNKLKQIQLGPNMFPITNSTFNIIEQES